MTHEEIGLKVTEYVETRKKLSDALAQSRRHVGELQRLAGLLNQLPAQHSEALAMLPTLFTGQQLGQLIREIADLGRQHDALQRELRGLGLDLRE